MTRLIQVVATQVGVTISGLHLEDALTELQDGDVIGSTTQVENGDLLVFLLLQPVGEGGRRWLVDDSQDLEPGDLPGVLGRLSLGVVEVGRNRNDGLRHGGPQVVLGRLLHLLQNHGRDLGGSVRLPGVRELHLNSVLPVGGHLIGDQPLLVGYLGSLSPHEPFDGEDGVPGVGNGLPSGHLTHQPLIVLREGHHGRCGPAPLGVRDDDGFAAFHDRHHRIGGSQVDSDHFAHICSSLAG